MTTIKEDQLKLLILILGEECSLLNINTKYFKEVELAEKVLMRENKDSSLFWACLQELSNRVKRLIKETEDLNAKEFERRKKSDHETRRFFENSLIFNSFPKPDALQLGMKYSGLVSHQDADLFYILKIDDQQYIPQIDLSKLVPLVEVPFMGSLVVFKTESGVLTRAIRVSAGPEMTEGIENIKLMMLETGETTFVEFKNNLYEMPDEFKKMPALANLCKLDQYNSTVPTAKEFINERLQKRIDFKVVGVEKAGTLSFLYDVLLVQVLPTTMPPLIPARKVNTNPFLMEENSGSDDFVAEETPKTTNLNLKIGTLIWIQPLKVIGCNSFYAQCCSISDMLNAFKLINHIKRTIPLPNLSQQTLDMNTEEALVRMKPYNGEDIGDLVIAKHDGIFYRAKVVSKNDGFCVVFFVDYGRKYKVENCNIRQFDEKYSVLPFQAILFQIGNVQYDKDMDDKKNECIQTLTRLLQAPVLVPAKLLRILNGGELIEVRLYDKSGEDIGEMLINEGYVKPKF